MVNLRKEARSMGVVGSSARASAQSPPAKAAKAVTKRKISGKKDRYVTQP